MAKKKIMWVPVSRTSFWPTRAPITYWYCVPKGSKPEGPGGYYRTTCGKHHTTKLGAERHCKKLNEEKS
jgi:hypothetical protein